MCQRVLFVFLYSVMLTGLVQAQGTSKEERAVASCSPVNIASTQIRKLYVEPPESFRLKSAGEKKCDIQVTFTNFPEYAKIAFNYAVSIWESLISSPVPIKVLARWDNLDGNILALSRPSTFHLNFNGAKCPDVYYPVALAEKLAGKNLNASEPDILCTFNNRYSWYFGTDGNTPINKYDFVSSVLHEITHGLGIAGFLRDKDGEGFVDSGNDLPSVYDFYIHNANDQQISNKSLFKSPSVELHQQLTSEQLKFVKSIATGEEKTDEWLYAPSNWKDGASVYHFDTKYDYGLMTPFASLGEAIHDPGENTIDILSKIGWQTVTFDFAELKDLEETCDSLPVTLGVISDLELDSSAVKLIYSFDYFSNADTVQLQYDKKRNKFYANFPVESQNGSIQYFFKTKTLKRDEFSWPPQAPSETFKFCIGPDKIAPQLVHNSVKMITKSSPRINFLVAASDNVGIKSVRVEYKLDGSIQEPIILENYDIDFYRGELSFNEGLTDDSKLEYRIIAEDKSSNGNQKILPSTGFYTVNMFSTTEPVVTYCSNFESTTTDFVLNDFTISRTPGFSGGILHTRHPYPASTVENEKYELIAQLRSPIIIQEDGVMQFDEVVLVEPGNTDYYSNQQMWDYVIVEGSKDNGKTWIPLCSGYDSGSNENWKSAFNSVINNYTSVAIGNENLSVQRIIHLAENNVFLAGDTVIFRFKLASDNTVNGWGWAIDNLEIQNLKTGIQNELVDGGIKIYPNPCSSEVFIDFSKADLRQFKDITITDLNGNAVLCHSNIDLIYDKKFRIDLSNKASGIYFVRITDEGKSSIIKKLIKR